MFSLWAHMFVFMFPLCMNMNILFWIDTPCFSSPSRNNLSLAQRFFLTHIFMVFHSDPWQHSLDRKAWVGWVMST